MDAQRSLAFGGVVAFVAAFWATFVLWNAAELALNLKLRSRSPERMDRSSFRALFLAMSAGLSFDFASAFLLPRVAFATAAPALFVAGICLVWLGEGLRLYAVATLGRYFTVEVAAKAAHTKSRGT